MPPASRWALSAAWLLHQSAERHPEPSVPAPRGSARGGELWRAQESASNMLPAPTAAVSGSTANAGPSPPSPPLVSPAEGVVAKEPAAMLVMQPMVHHGARSIKGTHVVMVHARVQAEDPIHCEEAERCYGARADEQQPSPQPVD